MTQNTSSPSAGDTTSTDGLQATVLNFDTTSSLSRDEALAKAMDVLQRRYPDANIVDMTDGGGRTYWRWRLGAWMRRQVHRAGWHSYVEMEVYDERTDSIRAGVMTCYFCGPER